MLTLDLPLSDIERVCYAGVFAGGLLTGVYAMLHGSVRVDNDPSAVKAPPAGFNAPVLGAALMSFGAVGYSLATYATLGALPMLLLAIIAGAVGWIGMTVLMATWAFKGPIVDPHEEVEELQGTIATTTKPITPDVLGEVTYVFRGERVYVPARSIHPGDVVTVGTDVVIEKIDDGIADVELWSLVEQRL